MALKSESERPSFDRGVKSRIAGNVVVTTFLMAVLLCFVNIGVHEFGRRNDVRFDLTRQQWSALEPSTREMLRGLESPLEVYMIVGWDQAINKVARPQLNSPRTDHLYRNLHYRPMLHAFSAVVIDFFSEVREVTPKVRFKWADATVPVDEPQEWARSLGLAAREMVNHLVFFNPATRQTHSISLYKIFDLDLNGPQRDGGFLPPSRIRGTILEQAVLFGFKSVRRSRHDVLGITVGHGEKELAGARSLLSAEGFTIRSINLGDQEEIPSDLKVLLIASPTRQWRPKAVQALSLYLKEGGRVLLLQGRVSREPFGHLLQEFGISIKRLLLEHDTYHSRNKGPDALWGPYFLQPMPGDDLHQITAPIVEAKLPVLLESFRAYELSDRYDREAVTRSVLAHSASGARAIPFVFEGEGTRKRPDLGIKSGDFPMMLAVEMTVSQDAPRHPEMRLIAAAGDMWVGDQRLSAGFNDANRDLFLNIIHWLAGVEQMISITPRAFQGDKVSITDERHATFQAITMGILPTLIVLAGLLVFFVRRR